MSIKMNKFIFFHIKTICIMTSIFCYLVKTCFFSQIFFKSPKNLNTCFIYLFLYIKYWLNNKIYLAEYYML